MESKNLKKNEDKSSSSSDKIIVAVRIAGEVKKKSDISDTLDRLRLKRKYTCTLINSSNKSSIGMLNKVKHSIAFGGIEEKTLARLISERGEKIKEPNKKYSGEINGEKIAEEILNGKNLSELGIKPFFRLHPPRGGIKSKIQYPKGVLGDNKSDINKLIARML